MLSSSMVKNNDRMKLSNVVYIYPGDLKNIHPTIFLDFHHNIKKGEIYYTKSDLNLLFDNFLLQKIGYCFFCSP